MGSGQRGPRQVLLLAVTDLGRTSLPQNWRAPHLPPSPASLICLPHLPPLSCLPQLPPLICLLGSFARQATRYADDVRALARARVVAASGAGGEAAGAERARELEEAVLRLLQGAVAAPPPERCE